MGTGERRDQDGEVGARIRPWASSHSRRRATLNAVIKAVIFVLRYGIAFMRHLPYIPLCVLTSNAVYHAARRKITTPHLSRSRIRYRACQILERNVVFCSSFNPTLLPECAGLSPGAHILSCTLAMLDSRSLPSLAKGADATTTIYHTHIITLRSQVSPGSSPASSADVQDFSARNLRPRMLLIHAQVHSARQRDLSLIRAQGQQRLV